MPKSKIFNHFITKYPNKNSKIYHMVQVAPKLKIWVIGQKDASTDWQRVE
jgi:hypothetical protein